MQIIDDNYIHESIVNALGSAPISEYAIVKGEIKQQHWFIIIHELIIQFYFFPQPQKSSQLNNLIHNDPTTVVSLIIKASLHYFCRFYCYSYIHGHLGIMPLCHISEECLHEAVTMVCLNEKDRFLANFTSDQLKTACCVSRGSVYRYSITSKVWQIRDTGHARARCIFNGTELKFTVTSRRDCKQPVEIA